MIDSVDHRWWKCANTYTQISKPPSHITSHLLNLKPSSNFCESNKSLRYISSCVVAKMYVPGQGQWALGEDGWWASCSRAARTLTLPTPSWPCVTLPWCLITYIYLALEELFIDPFLSRMLEAPPPGNQTKDCIVVALLKELSLSHSHNTN